MPELHFKHLKIDELPDADEMRDIRIRDTNHFVVGGDPTDSDENNITSNDGIRDLAINQKMHDRKINMLEKSVGDIESVIEREVAQINMLIPTGFMMQSLHIPKLMSPFWIKVNGDLISELNSPLLFNALKATGLDIWKPDSRGFIKLSNFNGTVGRQPNNNRFKDMEALELGEYQEDAGQLITGAIEGGAFEEDYSTRATGALRLIKRAFRGGAGNAGDWGFDFDSSRVARTADETRVKATGWQNWIFTGVTEKEWRKLFYESDNK